MNFPRLPNRLRRQGVYIVHVDSQAQREIRQNRYAENTPEWMMRGLFVRQDFFVAAPDNMAVHCLCMSIDSGIAWRYLQVAIGEGEMGTSRKKRTWYCRLPLE